MFDTSFTAAHLPSMHSHCRRLLHVLLVHSFPFCLCLQIYLFSLCALTHLRVHARTCGSFYTLRFYCYSPRVHSAALLPLCCTIHRRMTATLHCGRSVHYRCTRMGSHHRTHSFTQYTHAIRFTHTARDVLGLGMLEPCTRTSHTRAHLFTPLHTHGCYMHSSPSLGYSDLHCCTRHISPRLRCMLTTWMFCVHCLTHGFTHHAARTPQDCDSGSFPRGSPLLRLFSLHSHLYARSPGNRCTPLGPLHRLWFHLACTPLSWIHARLRTSCLCAPPAG